MRATGNLYFWFIITILLNVMAVQVQSIESSEEYLQKVMTELQKLNAPASPSAQNQVPFNVDYKNMIYESNDDQSYVKHAIGDNTHQDMRKHESQGVQRYTILPIDKIGLNSAESQQLPQHYQTRTPMVTKVQKPEAVGFTRAELAAMYKNALEKGSSISLSSLTNVLASGDKPQVTDTHLEFPAAKPMYQYYFFPLKSFMSELNKDHGYKTIPAAALGNRTNVFGIMKSVNFCDFMMSCPQPASALESTEATETSPQTQLANPLFVAISTFVSVALILMMGILFLPKLAQYGITHARDVQDEFLRLTNVVVNAIDRHSSLERFPDRHLDFSRYNSTRKIKRRKRKGGTVAVVKQKIHPVSW